MQVRHRIVAILAGIAMLGLAACSSVTTNFDQMALMYKGGIASSKTFEKCVPVSKRDTGGGSDVYYVYPVNQRSFDATGGKDADAPAPKIVTKDSVEMVLPYTVTMSLKRDCNTLRKFHETIGNKYGAWWGGQDFVDENEDDMPDGWVKMLNFSVGQPADSALDRIAIAYNWRDLWQKAETKLAVQEQFETDLQNSVDRMMGGSFFDIGVVTLQKPDPTNPKLKEAVADEQAAVSQAQSAQAQAAAQKLAAEAQVAVARAEAAKVAEQVRVLGVEGYIKKYAIDNDITPYPATVVPGSPAGR